MLARSGDWTQGWLVNAARCAYRNNNDPDNLNNNIGFRVSASHAFPSCKQGLRVLKELGDLHRARNALRPRDVSRGKTGEMAQSCPVWAFSVFINGQWRRAAPCGGAARGRALRQI